MHILGTKLAGCGNYILNQCVYIYIYIYIYIYLTPLPQAGCDTNSLFKCSPADLYSVLLLLNWLPYQEPSLPRLFTLAHFAGAVEYADCISAEN